MRCNPVNNWDITFIESYYLLAKYPCLVNFLLW